jgi:hypothetical protein
MIIFSVGLIPAGIKSTSSHNTRFPPACNYPTGILFVGLMPAGKKCVYRADHHSRRINRRPAGKYFHPEKIATK